MTFKIHLVSPRWYCAWVTRAIKILDETIKKYTNQKVYVNHEIIHNKYIIDFYKRKWVIFLEKNWEIEENSNLIISAHWIGPKSLLEFKSKNINIVDATCPLVNKVHVKAKLFLREWKKIIYIWKKWHQEAIWVIENWKENIYLIEKIEDISNLDFNKEDKLAILTQTTLSTLETDKIINKLKTIYPEIEVNSDDICYATTNRQNAILELTKICDLIIVVWSKNSSNSNKLKSLSESKWVNSILIDSYKEVPKEILNWKYKNIGISSWASAPEILVEELVEYLKQNWAELQKEIITKQEDITFK